MSLHLNRADHGTPSTLQSLSSSHDLPQPEEGIWQAGDGACLRYAHWQTTAAPRRGRVLFLNGRTEFIEKYLESYADLVRSGLDLWSLDWRGQGLSDRALADPQKGHISDYQTYLDDLTGFVQDITDLPNSDGPNIILAHSMGGHIGLRFLHDHPGLIECAVLLAPMIDIPAHQPPIRWLNKAIKQAGFATSYVWGSGPYKPVFNNPDDPDDNGTIEDYQARLSSFEKLSTDPQRRAILERHVRDNPDLALGGPTSGWLDATFRSIKVTMAPGFAEAIETPILMLGGASDKVVVNAALRKMATRLPKGDFRLIANAAHELLLENDDVRLDTFRAISAWIDVEIAPLSDQRRSA
ncbi:MAG: alpha/beta fold hydrolase [Geminicoccales bacterium]